MPAEQRTWCLWPGPPPASGRRSREAPACVTTLSAASSTRTGSPTQRHTPEAQEIAAKNFYRPIDPKVGEKYAKQFPPIKLFTIDDTFGGWAKAQQTHFSDGGVFDQIYTKK